MKVFYRISDKGNPKEKIGNAGKEACLKNATLEFGSDCFFVIADNCDPATVSMIRNLGLECEETSLGNSASFMHMLDTIISTLPDSEEVYLLEDDYVHLPGAKQVLIEGLGIADYVTLYDHPDKYVLEADSGNPFNHKKLKKTRVYATARKHWRETDSTTMTFACRVSTLKQDYEVWKKFTRGRIPDDFHGFMVLTQNEFSDMLSFFFRRRKREFFILFKNVFSGKKTRKLISAIPAHATHAEIKWLAPVVEWEK